MTYPLTITPALARHRGCCAEGIADAIAKLGRPVADDEPVTLVDLIDVGVSLPDVVRAAFVAGIPSRLAYRHWIIDVYQARREAALVVLPIFERDRPGDNRVRAALDAYPVGYALARRAVDNPGSREETIEQAMDVAYADAADAANAANAANANAATAAADAAHAANAGYAAYAANAANAANATNTGYVDNAGHAANAANAADAFRDGFQSWCRARLRARLAGDAVLPVPECPALAEVLEPLRVATAKKLGGGAS